ncbi:MAG: hypothetical protein IKZ82_01145 [Clostridia bacterium]|nr:hypothetical protein [Clostridia bacterium]
MYKFYGSEIVPNEIKILYDAFGKCWCAETCAPRYRDEWSETNKTLGQCSITAFIVQDLLGGRVLGVSLGGGAYHCINEIDGIKFDLTSEQFDGDDRVLDYENTPEQSREIHFADGDKYERYLLLKSLLMKRLLSK